MTTEHPPVTDFELYVMGELAPERCDALAEHVKGCDACARRLESEARVEVALYDVAESPSLAAPAARVTEAVPQPRKSRRGAAVMAIAAALAVAASYLVWLTRPDHAGVARAAERPWKVSCPRDVFRAQYCYASAEKKGFYVEDPPRAGPIPVYEKFGPLTREER